MKATSKEQFIQFLREGYVARSFNSAFPGRERAINPANGLLSYRDDNGPWISDSKTGVGFWDQYDLYLPEPTTKFDWESITPYSWQARNLPNKSIYLSVSLLSNKLWYYSTGINTSLECEGYGDNLKDAKMRGEQAYMLVNKLYELGQYQPKLQEPEVNWTLDY